MSKKSLTLLLIIALFLGGLTFYYGQPSFLGATALLNTETRYQNVSAKELNDWLNSGKDIILIDVREPVEYIEGYLKGSANVPLGQLESRLQEIPKDKDVVVYCRSGRRSAEASSILVKNGYQRVYNLEGGIINWSYELIKQQSRIDYFLKAA